MKNILVIGSVNMDLRVETDRVPQMGETLTGYGFSVSPGGKGANQAVAAAKLGGDVKFLAAVGDDPYGSVLVQNLENNGVSFEGAVIPNRSSGIAMITVCGGNNCIIIDSGANDDVRPALIDGRSDLFDWADYVLLQLEIPLETVAHIVKKAKAHNVKTVLNPAPYQPLSDDLCRDLDILAPNEHEAELLTGIRPDTEESCAAAVKAMLAKGVKTAVITLGERGCVYSDGDDVRFQDAFPAKAVDTTAAGDCFIGALCVRLAGGESLADAVRYASRASAVAVSRYGASDSIPSEAELEKES